jgi:hypothetical protein
VLSGVPLHPWLRVIALEGTRANIGAEEESQMKRATIEDFFKRGATIEELHQSGAFPKWQLRFGEMLLDERTRIAKLQDTVLRGDVIEDKAHREEVIAEMRRELLGIAGHVEGFIPAIALGTAIASQRLRYIQTLLAITVCLLVAILLTLWVR